MTNEPAILKGTVDWRRIILFCAFAFLISGSAAITIAMNGGLESLNGVQAMLILGAWYMPGPALAHLLTRAITREGWQDLWLRPRFRQGWRQWLVAWILPPLVVIGGAALYFAIFPEQYDATFGMMRSLLEQSLPAGQPLPISVEMVILIQIVQSLLIAPVINALPTLGEEFGWRAYLQPKLLPLGWRPAMIWMGVIWGVWHWPILAMGYNYGLAYDGAPWLGMLAFVWFTTTFGIVLGWLTLRGGSVWPAVIGHGALNGIAALPTLVMQGEPNPLLGPMAHGIIAGIPLALIALWMWFNAPVTPVAARDGEV